MRTYFKKIIKNYSLTCFLILFTLNIHAAERDSILVYVEQSDINNKINIVFENQSNDSIILLFSKLKNYHERQPIHLGFRILFYYNNRLVFPIWGELPQEYYSISDKKRETLLPSEKIKLEIEFPLFSEGLKNKDDEYGIVIELNYRYYNTEKKVIIYKDIKTDYFKL